MLHGLHPLNLTSQLGYEKTGRSCRSQRSRSMKSSTRARSSRKLSIACGVLAILTSANCASAQVQTEVPAPVPGAKPVAVENIKVHGTALEDNLEGDDVDRTVIVFLPPG